MNIIHIARAEIKFETEGQAASGVGACTLHRGSSMSILGSRSRFSDLYFT